MQSIKELFSINRPVFWARKSIFALMDHGFIAGGNFILNIVLARWLEPEHYGAFVLVYSVFLFIMAFHTAMITEPMTVFGAGKYAQHFKEYLGIVLFAQVGLLVVLIPLLGVSFILSRLYSPEVKSGVLLMGMVSPMILLIYIVRRAFYIIMKPGIATICSVLNSVLLLSFVYYLWLSDNLSQHNAFLGMGLSAFFVSVLFIRYLHPQWKWIGNPKASIVATDHWHYGRWALATSLLIWLSGNFYYFILPAWIGLQEIATLRALLNLSLPMGHATLAFSSLFIPLLSDHFNKDGFPRMMKTLKLFLSFLVTSSALFLLLLSVFKRDILDLLYAGKYMEYDYLVPLVGLLPVAGSFVAVFAGAMKAIERPDKIFWSYVISTSVGLTLGITLVVMIGFKGALWGMLMAYITTGSMLYLFLAQLSRQWRFR